MMLTPWGPRAVPTGGAGVAAPAWSCTLTSAAIFFLGGISFSLYLVVGTRAPTLCHWCCFLLSLLDVVSRLTGFRDASRSPSLRSGLRRRSSTFSRCCPSHAQGNRSNLLDLGEAQLDRGLPAEDLDEGLDPLCLGVDLGDRRVQRGERTVDHHDRVGDLEVRDGHLLAGGGLRGGAAGTLRCRCRLGLRLDSGSEHV